MSNSRRVLKVLLPILATVAIMAPLAWLWQASRVPGVYSVMDMGYPDYGGGAAPDAGGGHGGHVQGHMHHPDPRRLITELVVDPARPADLRVDLVARLETLVVGGPVDLGIHRQRHVTRTGDPCYPRSADRDPFAQRVG